MARIGIAGFLHETNTFAASRADFRAFAEADAWPALLIGAEIPIATAGMNLAISGFIDALRGTTHRLVPLVWASAGPSGPVTRDAFEAVSWLLDRALAEAGPLDALLLDLHGAMVAEHLDDGEGELLRRIRERIGPDTVIVAALDFHANVSRAMVEQADLMVSYRSYPHVDIAETGRRAAALLERRLRSGARPAVSHLPLPLLIPMPWQSSLAEPMRSLMSSAAALETGAVWSANFIPGFPLADIPDAGPSVLVYADGAPAAERAAGALYDTVLAAREGFRGRLYDAASAVARALEYRGDRVVILADTQDNPGGGGSGDTTDILHALRERRAQRACAAIVHDPAFASAAHAAGVGATIEAPLGGQSKIGAPPLAGLFEILALGDGRFSGTGPFYRGCRMDLGPMARVRTGGIEIIVSSRRQQAADQAMFRHVGAEPADYRILVLKSSVHFRADFGALADEILVVAAPGANTADLRQLAFHKLRPGVRIL
jgi:microcystin degradation protein MlrC